MATKIDLLNDHTKSADVLAWREFYIPLFTVISLGFCITAQILFYIFPRLRIFPRSLLSWLNIYNIYYCIYAILKWTPGTPWHAAWASHIVAGSPECRISLLIDVSTMAGQSTCTTLLSLTVFLVIVVQFDIERHKNTLFWSYFATVTVYPFSFGAAAAFGFGTSWEEGSSCVINNTVGNLVIRIPYSVMFICQIIFLGSTLFYVRSIFSSVHSTNSFPIAYLYARFMATFIAQTFNMLPAQFAVTFPAISNQHQIFIRFMQSSHSIGSTLDALVMIFGNVDFMNFSLQKLSQWRSHLKRSPSLIPSHTPISTAIYQPTLVREYSLEDGIPLEEMHLPTSDGMVEKHIKHDISQDLQLDSSSTES